MKKTVLTIVIGGFLTLIAIVFIRENFAKEPTVIKDNTKPTKENGEVIPPYNLSSNSKNETKATTTKEKDTKATTKAKIDKQSQEERSNYEDKLIEQQKQENEKQREIEESKAAARQEEIEKYNKKVEKHNARVKNTYKNDNPGYLNNTVNINPALVYYNDNGELYFTYFLNNGLSTIVYDIKAYNIRLYNKDKELIACKDYVEYGANKGVPAHSYATFNEILKGDEVKIIDADLSVLYCEAKTTYNY